MSSLFRSQVLNSPSDSSLGELVIARSLASWMLVVFAVGTVVVITSYLWFGAYTKRTNATGILLPVNGISRVFASSSGVVSEKFISEGEHVTKGQKLFVVEDERALLASSRLSDGKAVTSGTEVRNLASFVNESLATRLETLETERLQTQQQLLKAQASLREKIFNLQSEREMLQYQIRLDEQRFALAKEQLDRDQQLEQAHFLSSQALQQRRDGVIDGESRLVASRRNFLALKQEQADAESELIQMPSRIAAQLASFDQKKAAIEQEQAESKGRSRSVVVAPTDGVITAILAEPGTPVSQQPLATVLPAGSELEAHLFIPSKSAGFVEPGQKVRLRYQPYPYQKFGQYSGSVKQVSRAPLSQDSLPPGVLPMTTEGGVYRVTVKLDSQNVMTYGHVQTLAVGTLVEADILQDTRRLIEWVFEPVFSINGKLGG